MRENRKIPKATNSNGLTVKNKTDDSDKKSFCHVNFKYFKLDCRKSRGFNNHFGNSSHYQDVLTNFIGKILPEISSLTPATLNSDGLKTDQFHFHKIDSDHIEKVRAVLKLYSFNDTLINQFLDGEQLFEFAGNLKGKFESRIICENIDNVLYFLFFDTNHHIYFDKDKAGKSSKYLYCPYKDLKLCNYLYVCTANEFLDQVKIEETYNYGYSPEISK